MDIIYTDENKKEIGIFNKYVSIDFEVGSIVNGQSTNDFEITFPSAIYPEEIKEGSLIYEEGSEIGGYIDGLGADTSLKNVYAYGLNWRGLLASKVIEPTKGNSYFQCSGEANSQLSKLVDDKFDGLIVASSKNSNIQVSRDFRYTNLLEGIERMLSERGAKLKLTNIIDDDGFHVEIEAVPINDRSDEIQFDNDYGLSLIAKKRNNGINHIICLGTGELADRQVVHLYKLADGTITQNNTNAFKGLKERTLVYDYSNVESLQELIKGGTEKFDEELSTETLEMNVYFDVDIGDVVNAKENTTQIEMTKTITLKTYKGYIDNVEVEYKVGEN